MTKGCTMPLRRNLSEEGLDINDILDGGGTLQQDFFE